MDRFSRGYDVKTGAAHFAEHKFDRALSQMAALFINMVYDSSIEKTSVEKAVMIF